MVSWTDFKHTETKMSLEYKEAISSPTQPQRKKKREGSVRLNTSKRKTPKYMTGRVLTDTTWGQKSILYNAKESPARFSTKSPH